MMLSDSDSQSEVSEEEQSSRVLVRIHPALQDREQHILNTVKGISRFQVGRDRTEPTIDRDFYYKSTKRKINSIADSCLYLLNVVLRERSINLPSNLDETEFNKDDLFETMCTFIDYHRKLYLFNIDNIRNTRDITSGAAISEDLLRRFAQSALGLICESYNLSLEEACEMLDRADCMRILTKPREQIVSVIPVPAEEPGEYVEDCFTVLVDTPMPCISPELAQEYLDYLNGDIEPDWVQPMSAADRQMLLHELQGAKTPEDISARMVNFSSRLRIIPGLPNTYIHQCYLVEGDTCKLVDQEGSSGMIVSRELYKRKQDPELQFNHALHNARVQINHQLAECVERYIKQHGSADNIEIPILYQTLITPDLGGVDKHAHDIKKAVCRKLNEDMSEGVLVTLSGDRRVLVKPIIFETNHPINYGVLKDNLKGERPDTRELLDFLKERLQRVKFSAEDVRDVKTLIEECEKDMQVSLNLKKETNQNLILCGHEQLAVQRAGGFTIGSCWSGKDRKRTQEANTSSQAIAHELDEHKKYPSFHREKSGSRSGFSSFFSSSSSSDITQDSTKRRDHHVRIFAEILCSRHHQTLAGENAPGAEGTKNISIYLGSGGRHEKTVHDTYVRLLGPEMKDMKIFKVENRIAGRNEMSRLCQIKKLRLEQILPWYDQFCTQAVLKDTRLHIRDIEPDGLIVALRDFTSLTKRRFMRVRSTINSVSSKLDALIKLNDEQMLPIVRRAIQYAVLSKIESEVLEHLVQPRKSDSRLREFYVGVLSHCEPALDQLYQSFGQDLGAIREILPDNYQLFEPVNRVFHTLVTPTLSIAAHAPVETFEIDTPESESSSIGDAIPDGPSW